MGASRCCSVLADGDVTHRRGAEALTFHCEVREFIERVEDTECSVELEAVDHDRRVGEHHMFGANVAVRLDDAGVLNAGIEEMGAGLEE
jgi:hypothetical protein